VLRDFERRDLIGLAIYDSGARCFYNTRRPIVVPEDLHGLKLRVPLSDIFMTMLRQLGANPTPLSYGDVFSALETHLIDGAENNIRSFHASRHFEGAKFWSRSAHSYAPDALLISRRSYDTLTSSQQDLIRATATASVKVMRDLWDTGEDAARDAIEAGGVRSNDVDTAAFRRAVAPVLSEFTRDPAIETLVRAIRDAGDSA
jgi:TRAP-type C4-dicarboxylate transport system substrate-binding protein